MSSDSNSITRSTSENSILLIEEYDALVAAISSALKKFAPHHSVQVAESLAEAARIAPEICPALIIFDFDPSGGGATDFLLRMRETCPDSRVIVMGAGVSAETASEFRGYGAVHFLAKPFEVPEFGATVQALLGPTRDTASAATLRSLGAADLTLVQCAGSRSAFLQVHGGNGKIGEISIVDGQITHAKAGRRKDLDALEEIFGWTDARVEELESQPVARTIRANWNDVFIEAVIQIKPRRLERAATPAPVSAPERPKPKAKTGKKIVAVDDTEMLLVFVEDILTLADRELQISTAPNGITGIKEIEGIQPDLVLLDYSLPDINGDEVCRRLLQNERTARIPVLMMSGHVPEMMSAAAKFDNIVATIAKPFMSEPFAALVQQTLSKGLRPTPKIRPPAPPTVAKPSPLPKPVVAKSPPPEIPKPAPVRPLVVEKTLSPPEIRKSIEIPKTVIEQPLVAPVIQPPPSPRTQPAIARSTSTPPELETRGAEIPPAFTTTAPSKFITAPVTSHEATEVVLGLFLEVLSMQLTPSLRMGTIRAKPSAPTVSLHVSPASAIPIETGFRLGRVQLGSGGGLETLRLIPTSQPPQRLVIRNAFELGALDLVPNNSREEVRMTPSAHAPMMMQLLAHFELAGVELSNTFQLAELVLKVRSNTVRVTLSAEAIGQEKTGVFCETVAVHLDNNGQLAELLLKPLK